VIQIGDVLEVTVTSVQHYGLFVSADDIPGLILIPELSWGRISHPSEIATVGDSLKCKVIRLPPDPPPEKPQFTASIRALTPEQNPWRDPNVYAVGTRFRGPITMECSYGYFVHHPNGALVLIHVDDIPAGLSLSDGTEVSVTITECDVEGQKVRAQLVEMETDI